MEVRMIGQAARASTFEFLLLALDGIHSHNSHNLVIIAPVY